MRQNGATSAPIFYCVSYEILCETRIKPGFFGNCLISLSSAGGPVPGLSIRANGSSLPLVLIKRIAHVRGGGGLPSPPSLGGHLPQRGRRDLAFCNPLVSCLLGSPFGGAGTAAAVTERASSRDAGAVRRLRGQPTPGARVPVVRTGAAFSRQSRLPARSVLNGLHWGPGPLFP